MSPVPRSPVSPTARASPQSAEALPGSASPSQVRSAKEQWKQNTLAAEIKGFLEMNEGSGLRAWLKHFDTNDDQKISVHEFSRGMRKLNYSGDVLQVFEKLDWDNSGELSLEEIDKVGANVWYTFRKWCVTNFDGPLDLLKRLSGQTTRNSTKSKITGRLSETQGVVASRGSVLHGSNKGPETSASMRRGSSVKRESSVRRESGGSMSPRMSARRVSDDIEITVSKDTFKAGLRREGWEHEDYEDTLFIALDKDNNGVIGVAEMKWLDTEKKRQAKKDHAKRRAELEQTKSRGTDWKAAEESLDDFKHFLKRRHGSYLSAWRLDLCPPENPDTMVLQKADLFKALNAIGWAGDVRLLYKILDKDDSGYISFAELDPQGAESLAYFKYFIQDTFGNASKAFKVMDKYNIKKLKQQEFCNAFKAAGYRHGQLKQLFHGLDRTKTKRLLEEDMLFLDKWKPAPYLCHEPNPQAVEEFKACLENNYKTYIKAWRHVLDTDASNRCSYDEFSTACNKLKFTGDVPGVWRALDDDMSGFITLYEIDPVSSNTLQSFRDWCTQEFGGVRYAFEVFDATGDNEVNYSEFRRSCRIYGYEGRPHPLFFALDIELNGSLSTNEVAFLDKWEFNGNKGNDNAAGIDGTVTKGEGDGEASVREVRYGARLFQTPVNTTNWVTEGPGPGAYNIPAGVGCGPGDQASRFAGAYSFRKRILKDYHICDNRLPGIPDGPSAHAYHQRGYPFAAVAPSHPTWEFGTEQRKAVEAKGDHSGPGPADYCPRRRKGPAVGCTPRRPLRLHPLYFSEIG